MEDIKEVFISYHEKSAGKLVAQIAKQLESAGISCWHASRNVLKGDDFKREIMASVRRASSFFVGFESRRGAIALRAKRIDDCI